MKLILALYNYILEMAINSFRTEARLSQELSSARSGLLSAQGAPRKAVDLDHTILGGIPFSFIQNLDQYCEMELIQRNRRHFQVSREQTGSVRNELIHLITLTALFMLFSIKHLTRTHLFVLLKKERYMDHWC